MSIDSSIFKQYDNKAKWEFYMVMKFTIKKMKDIKPHIFLAPNYCFKDILALNFPMERATRLELATVCLEGRNSSQLSYTRIFSWWAYLDLNQGPTGYEPVALTNWAIDPKRYNKWLYNKMIYNFKSFLWKRSSLNEDLLIFI